MYARGLRVQQCSVPWNLDPRVSIPYPTEYARGLIGPKPPPSSAGDASVEVDTLMSVNVWYVGSEKIAGAMPCFSASLRNANKWRSQPCPVRHARVVAE